VDDSPPSPAAGGRQVDDIAEQFVEDWAALSPLTATYVGIAGHESELPDLTLDGYAAREELMSRSLSAMRSADVPDDRARAAQASFVERLTVSLEEYAAMTPQSQVSVVESELHTLRSAFDLMSTDGEQAWAAIEARLSGLPAALADYRQTLLRCADGGHVSARRQLAAVADQIRLWTGEKGTSGNVFASLVSGAAVPGTLKRRLEASASAATAAYTDFAGFLERDLLPRGRGRDAVGRERYERASRSFLGATIDLDETYAWGWEELRRIEDEMQRVARRIVSSGTVPDAIEALDAEPDRVIEGKEPFRDWMQELADTTIRELAGVHFDIPEPVRRIECCLAPTSDGAIYYTGPSEDWSRPGRMWWAVPEGVDQFSTWQEVTTVYHEGVPGHHLQVAQTAYRKEHLNRWQRTMCWVSGHGEGWALYAERLMDDLGYLEDPGHRLGMLDGQSLRAARVIVDIGMHLELPIPSDNPFGFAPGRTWTPELGLDFLRQHCRLDDAVIRFEHLRYLGWPGQAPSYKVGERIWLQARDEVRARQGAAFDLREFHRAALDLGSIGLDPLREALARL
jgi:uncharacterized protein (DUF885 family)